MKLKDSTIASEKLMTPFCKSDGMTIDRDNFNFLGRAYAESQISLFTGFWKLLEQLHSFQENKYWKEKRSCSGSDSYP